MRILRDINDMELIDDPVAMAAGTLDGIHIGHRAVISTAVEHARDMAGQAWVLTFEPHPRKLLRGDEETLLLTSLPHKLRLIENLNVDGCVLLPFTGDLCRQPPSEFIERLCAKVPALREIIVGADWRFGANADGDVELLRSLSGAHKFEVAAIDPVAMDGEAVSSTRIRKAVARGDLASAGRMLGRPFSVLGTVISGRRIGRKLGYPTANLTVGSEIEPPPGIYAVYTMINGHRHDGVAYYGSRPTFADESHELLLEVHLFDGSFDLYSAEMEVCFIEYIRADRHFDSTDELKTAIESDCDNARRILKSLDNSDAARHDHP